VHQFDSAKKQKLMEGDSRNLEKNTDWESGDQMHDAGTLFQSIRLRRGPVLVDRNDWNVMESQFRLVLYSGILFWALHLLSLAL